MTDLHETERVRFEAWFKRKYLRAADIEVNLEDLGLWQAWQAALAPAVPQWIPVSERLPDVDKARCFVIAPGASSGDLWPTEWDAENRVFAAAFGGCFKCSEVTHWMYADRLPAPPGASEQAQPAVPQWMPIETAPKDGTFVLCFRYLRGIPDVSTAQWKQKVESFGGQGWHYPAGSEDCPTHWMPLPAAPSAKEPK